MQRRSSTMHKVGEALYVGSMLKFDGAWRFESPSGEAIPWAAVNDISNIINKIAAQGDHWDILEHFKEFFAGAAGNTASRSSSMSWAESDLDNHLRQAAANPPLFIEAIYDGCEALRKNGDLTLPTVEQLNRLLAKHDVPWEIRPPNLVSLKLHPEPVPVSTKARSLTEEAQELVQKSLSQSQLLLAEGRDRQAVQEILWLLETVSTAFQGVDTDGGTVQGKYFNKIVADLRRRSHGTTLEQVIDWVTTLHGYLSSPTGGGVRHGAQLERGHNMTPNEAHLFCNLIRSYISFLIVEHERLAKP